MKTLILQRHAKAEKDGDDDLCRSLTPVGLSDADFQGETLRQQEIFPELILHSHATRAKQTAEIMAVKLELSQGYTVEDANLYNCDSFELIAMIRNLPDDVDSILIVGHNPAIEIAADALGNSSFGHFRPSEAAVFTFDIEEWRSIAPRACIDNQFLPKPE
jgi:phosphohistidine phosphatase